LYSTPISSTTTIIMRFFIVTSLLAALAAATSTDNDFSNPAGGYSFTAGSSTTLTWDHKVGSTVTLRLQSGSITTATSGTVIACKSPNLRGVYASDVPREGYIISQRAENPCGKVTRRN
jgi:hypothetical protein